jgi:quinol monooxygenase YgiN
MDEHAIIWEFRVHRTHVQHFLAAYAPGGTWAALFRRDPAYLGTELLRDRDDPLRFLTIDRWTSAEAYARFRQQHAEDYENLDELCTAWTESEQQIGVFD